MTLRERLPNLITAVSMSRFAWTSNCTISVSPSVVRYRLVLHGRMDTFLRIVFHERSMFMDI